MLPSKKAILHLLKEKKYAELPGISSNTKKIISSLISLSYDKKSLVSWRAIEAIGFLTKEIAKSNTEDVRNIVGRLLWMMRDESGGIGWSVPEILGEIVRNNPELCSDIAPIIMSIHIEKMLTSGVLRAVGRIGKINTAMVEYSVPLILPYLHSSDQTLRGYAAWALGELGAPEAVNSLEKLKNDKNLILFYEEGELKEIPVGDTATKAIAKILKG